MNKKILYGILLLSLFLLSTAAMVQPVRGYEFGVPKQAVGVTTNGEVKIFDEDSVEDHLGKGVDLGGLHAGDSDVVGAKSATHYVGIERDEKIDYLHKFVFDPAGIPATVDQIDSLLLSMCANLSVWPAGTYGPVAWLANYSVRQILPLFSGLDPGIDALIAQTFIETGLSIGACAAFPAYATLKSKYSKDYDGVILDRETWDYHEDEADLAADDPDDDDDPAPFFADPRDWNDVAENLQAAQYEIGVTIDNIQTHWADLGGLMSPLGPDPTGAGWYGNVLAIAVGLAMVNPALAFGPGGVYTLLNSTIKAQIEAIPPTNTMDIQAFPLFGDCDFHTVPMWMALKAQLGVENNLSELLGMAGLPAFTEDYIIGLAGLGDFVFETIYAQFHALVPDKGGFLLGQLLAGQPAMVPQDDFIAKVLDEYNLDEEDLSDMYGFEYGKDIADEYGCKDGEISATPVGAKSRFTGVDLGGETVYPKAYIDFKVEGSNFIAEIEWPENMIDPADMTVFGGKAEDELDDFEIEFPYGDTGGQGTVSYKDGTEIFWQMGGVESIPGYEITIILGVSAISILGVIYILMRKRKM